MDEFKRLVDDLEDIEVRRSGSGGFASPEDAARRQQIERRLLELLRIEIPGDERRHFVRLPCDLWVKLKTSTADPVAAEIVDVGAGGVYVETTVRAYAGQPVEVEIERRPGTLEHGLKVRGKVAWSAESRRSGRPGLGIAFAADDDASERRLRRFVIELLRKRLPPA